MKHVLKCKSCSSYTLKSKCKCGGEVLRPIPPKYSPLDKYGKYRREVKVVKYKEGGLL